MAKKGRNAGLVALRNEALLARYYYWSVICERRFDSVLDILSKQEFFITEATIMRELLHHDEFLQELIRNKVTITQLSMAYPEWNWRPNTRFGYDKKQMRLF